MGHWTMNRVTKTFPSYGHALITPKNDRGNPSFYCACLPSSLALMLTDNPVCYTITRSARAAGASDEARCLSSHLCWEFESLASDFLTQVKGSLS